MSEKILCVDDDPNVLASYQRSFRKRFEIEATTSPEEALAMLARQGPFAVVVSDLRMPGMDGLRFLSEVRKRAPDTVRIMLTGNNDLDAAMAAVNEGNVFRFLTKPCPPEVMATALTAGIAQYYLVTAEKELLQKTLRGSVKVLMDVLALVSPTAFGRGARVRRLARQLSEQLGGSVDWQIEFAAMLSQLGCVTLPEETLVKVSRGETLFGPELRMFQEHPKAGHDLLVNIPRLEGVATIIKYQEKRHDGTGVPGDDKRGDNIPLGARILKVALDFDSLLSSGCSSAKAVRELRAREGWYDPAIVEGLATLFKQEMDYEIRLVRVAELTGSMILAEDIMSSSGLLLLAKGQEVTPSVRLRLTNIAAKGGLVEPIKVLQLAPSAQAAESGAAGPA